MPVAVLLPGDCRAWASDGLGGFVCVEVADGASWTLDPGALASAFGAGLLVVLPVVGALIAGYSILRAIRGR